MVYQKLRILYTVRQVVSFLSCVALAPNIVQLRAVVEIVVIVHGLAVLGWDNVGTRDPCQSCAHQVSELVAGSDNTASSLVMIFAGFDME